MTNVRDQFDFDIDVFSKTLNSAYELMENYIGNKKVKQSWQPRQGQRAR